MGSGQGGGRGQGVVSSMSGLAPTFLSPGCLADYFSFTRNRRPPVSARRPRGPWQSTGSRAPRTTSVMRARDAGARTRPGMRRTARPLGQQSSGSPRPPGQTARTLPGRPRSRRPHGDPMLRPRSGASARPATASSRALRLSRPPGRCRPAEGAWRRWPPPAPSGGRRPPRPGPCTRRIPPRARGDRRQPDWGHQSRARASSTSGSLSQACMRAIVHPHDPPGRDSARSAAILRRALKQHDPDTAEREPERCGDFGGGTRPRRRRARSNLALAAA